MGQNIHRNMVIQFNESHKWCGCLGIISDVKDDGRYIIGVPIPNNEGESFTAFIFANRDDFDTIGESVIGFEE